MKTQAVKAFTLLVLLFVAVTSASAHGRRCCRPVYRHCAPRYYSQPVQVYAPPVVQYYGRPCVQACPPVVRYCPPPPCRPRYSYNEPYYRRHGRGYRHRGYYSN